MAYPSGHTANILLVYGLVPYLLGTYARVSGAHGARAGPAGRGAVVGLMVTVSVTLTWHWLADLWAGLLIGGMVLALTVRGRPRDPAGHVRRRAGGPGSGGCRGWCSAGTTWGRCSGAGWASCCVVGVWFAHGMQTNPRFPR